MRYISALPQRSQIIASSLHVPVLDMTRVIVDVFRAAGSAGIFVSAISGIIESAGGMEAKQ